MSMSHTAAQPSRCCWLSAVAAVAAELSVNAGCCTSNATCSESDPSVVTCLRKLNTTQIEDASKNLIDGTLQWAPVIDGVDVVGTRCCRCGWRASPCRTL